MTGIRGSELTAVCKVAEEMAKGRGERVTTGHLLAAIASGSGVAADLLMERRLDAEVLLKAARVLTDDHTDAVSRAMQRARELAARSPTRDAAAIHLLFVLCQERVTAAYRAIAQCGSDVAKLRTAAMQAALGIVGARRMRPNSDHPPSLTSPGRPATQLSLPPSSPPALALTDHLPNAASAAASPSHRKAAALAIPAGAPRPRRQRQPTPAGSPDGQAQRFELDRKRFPTLAALGRNLTLAAARGELDPVFGRESEIERTLDVLAKRHGNCPCLVGPAGVGKTSIVRGLAQRVATSGAVALPDDRIVVEIDSAALLSGTAVRGALAERMTLIQAEVAASQGRVVLVFDELQTLLAGDEESGSELKAALARGELHAEGGSGLVTLAGTIPGELRAIEVDGSGAWFAERGSMIAAEGSLNFDIAFTGLRMGLRGHEGFVLQKFTGSGTLFLAAAGNFIELNPAKYGGTIQAETGNVVAFQDSLQYTIERVGGLNAQTAMTALFGGEGINLATFRGEGTVILQSTSIHSLGEALRRVVDSHSEGDRRGPLAGLGL